MSFFLISASPAPPRETFFQNKSAIITARKSYFKGIAISGDVVKVKAKEEEIIFLNFLNLNLNLVTCQFFKRKGRKIMKKLISEYRFSSDDEPDEEILGQLMHEVAVEAQKKSELAKSTLDQVINNQVNEAMIREGFIKK